MWSGSFAKERSAHPLVGFFTGWKCCPQLTGELGDQARGLLTAVCAVSTPIDLKACSLSLGKPENILYEQRFLQRLRARIRLRHKQAPEVYSLEPLKKIRTIYDFDDLYTGPLFGFGNADTYTTQSGTGLSAKFAFRRCGAGRRRSADSRRFDHRHFARIYLTLIAVGTEGISDSSRDARPRFWLTADSKLVTRSVGRNPAISSSAAR